MQLEAARPAQEQAPPVRRVRPALREQALELDESRVHEERAASAERHLCPLEAERVLEERRRVLVGVAAARQPVQDVARVEPPAAPAKRRPPFAEPADPLDDDDGGRRNTTLMVEVEVDAQVVAFEVILAAGEASEPHRPLHEPHPDPGEEDDEEEAGRDRVERLRAEGPRGDVRGGAEREREAAVLRQTGTGVRSSASRTTSTPERPVERVSGARISRCASTAGATAFTSSGTRYSRPSASARAFATRRSAIPERGLAPR